MPAIEPQGNCWLSARRRGMSSSSWCSISSISTMKIRGVFTVPRKQTGEDFIYGNSVREIHSAAQIGPSTIVKIHNSQHAL
jgi:hypothetical protein